MKAAGSKSMVSSQEGEAKLATVCRLEGKEERLLHYHALFFSCAIERMQMPRMDLALPQVQGKASSKYLEALGWSRLGSSSLEDDSQSSP